ncbi:hypothetical protein BaRGS_00000397 [Batillaria attramentaria]|uniref:Reelin domain-containing protein n=1 Tax=Batillaria attramentaria TaxID=370345 RepID=A0ABD0MA86_9CAEN
MLLRITATVLVVTGFASGYSSGPPSSTCADLFPGHGVDPQTSDTPFSILLSTSSYSPGESVQVTLSGNVTYKGVFLQARSVNCTNDSPVGTFSTQDAELQTIQCAGQTDSVGHNSGVDKNNTKVVTWTAPQQTAGHLFFRATFVHDYSTIWNTTFSAFLRATGDSAPLPQSPCGTEVLLCFLALVVSGVHGYGSGAPPKACSKMFPGHHVDAQTSAPPYSITVAATSYTPGQQDAISVTVSSDNTAFRGLMVQARSVSNCDQQVGTFRLDTSEANLKLIQCTQADDTVTHTDTNAKPTKTFFWIPPANSMGHVYFRATVAQMSKVFWTTVDSGVVRDASQISGGSGAGDVMCKPPKTQAEAGSTSSHEGDSHESDDGNSASVLQSSLFLMTSLLFVVVHMF